MELAKPSRQILTEMVALLVAGALSLLIANLVAGTVGGAGQLALNLGWAAFILSVLAVAFGAIRWRSRLREQGLSSRSPHGVVFGTARPDGLLRVLRDVSGDQHLRAPTDMSVVADAEGISLWTGPPRLPVLIYRLPWRYVRSIKAGPIAMASIARPGLLVKLNDGHNSMDFALQPIGAGLLGMYPLRGVQVDRLAQALRDRASRRIESD